MPAHDAEVPRRTEFATPVAEQVAVRCDPAVLLAILGRPRRGWIQPFLALSYSEAARAGGPIAPPAAAVVQSLRLGAAQQLDNMWWFRFTWSMSGDGSVFRRLDGRLELRPFEGATALGLVGGCLGLASEAGSEASSLRPVEVAVRGLLGRVRSALEAGRA